MRDTKDSLFIEGLGEFRALRGEVASDPYCFEQRRPFGSHDIFLIVYPNEDSSWPSRRQRSNLRKQFESFCEHVGDALLSLPSLFRPLCGEYGIEVRDLTDESLLKDLHWSHVKLISTGATECIAVMPSVSRDLDVVIEFSAEHKIADVHFDG